MTHRLLLALPCLALLAIVPAAQEPSTAVPPVARTPGAEARARRVRARIDALEQEATRLAGQSRTLIGDLRAREIERDLRVENLREAEAASADAARALEAATAGLADLELQHIDEIPKLETELVNLYKRGRVGYARLLLGAGSMREFTRAIRAVAALAARTDGRIESHRKTIESLRRERITFEERAAELQVREAEARQARRAADRAVAAAAELIKEIDSRRDLTAQYVGELRMAAAQLDAQVQALADGNQVEAVAVPIRPFHGALDWPVDGTVIGGFGQKANRLGSDLTRSGVEVAASIDAPVHAVHGGTVGFAGPFTGFGNLVILDHGGEIYSLYGYLGATAVRQGERVESGAEVGSVGFAPAGPAALYFEMRVDGRPVNPVEWLKPL